MNRYGIHPIREIEEIASYREDHRGIPLMILAFMGLARTNAFLVIVIISSLPYIIINAPAIVGIIMLAWNMIFGYTINSRFDFFRPLGFHLFAKILITQR